MGDLISREVLIEAVNIQLQNALDGVNITGMTLFKQKAVDCKNFIALIKEMSTVEPPKGEWKQRTDFDADNNAIFECSNCFHSDVQAKGCEVPFCWYCGAEMEKEK